MSELSGVAKRELERVLEERVNRHAVVDEDIRETEAALAHRYTERHDLKVAIDALRRDLGMDVEVTA